MNEILNANIYQSRDDKVISYSQNNKLAKNIKDVLFVKVNTRPDNPNIYDKFHKTTKNRLAFLDGVLDFKAKRFYTWDEIDFEYYTTIQIKRNFKSYFEKPNKMVIEEIKTKLYKNTFGDKLDLGLKFLSRAITGNCEDKKYGVYIGNRNSGKGANYDNLKYGFEDYVDAFELSNVQYQRNTESGEASKKLYWLIDLEFKRLAISQEIPSVDKGMKLCGKTWKKLCGGKDEHIARRNYDRQDTHFTIDTTFFIMGNNELLYDCPDTKLEEVEFLSVNQFKTQVELDKMVENDEDPILIAGYKLKDEAIKDKCATEEWSNAIVYLLYQYWRDEAVVVLKESQEDDDDSYVALRKKIVQTYNITGQIGDVILVSDVEAELKESKKNIKKELESMGVIKKKCNNSTYRDKYCYFGISLKFVEEE